MVWSGNRTRDSRFTRPMLYPTELSSGDVPDSNRCNQRELMPNLSAIVVMEYRLPLLGIRHGSAARTGWDTNPRRWEVSVGIPHCRLSPTGNPFGRLAPVCCAIPSTRRSRRSITTRRTCARCSRAPASGAQRSCARMLQGGNVFPQVGMAKRLRAMRVLCERQKQNAPGCRDPRAFASPREIGVADLPGSSTGCQWTVSAWPSPRLPWTSIAQAHASAPRRDGRRSNRYVLAKVVFMGKRREKHCLWNRGRAPYAHRFRCATFF